MTSRRAQIAYTPVSERPDFSCRMVSQTSTSLLLVLTTAYRILLLFSTKTDPSIDYYTLPFVLYSVLLQIFRRRKSRSRLGLPRDSTFSPSSPIMNSTNTTTPTYPTTAHIDDFGKPPDYSYNQTSAAALESQNTQWSTPPPPAYQRGEQARPVPIGMTVQQQMEGRRQRRRRLRGCIFLAFLLVAIFIVVTVYEVVARYVVFVLLLQNVMVLRHLLISIKFTSTIMYCTDFVAYRASTDSETTYRVSSSNNLNN